MNEQVSVGQGTTEPGQAALQALQEEGTGIFGQSPDAGAEAVSVTGETALDEHGGLYGAPSTEGAAPISLETDALRPAEKVIEPEIVNEGTTIEVRDELSTDNGALNKMASTPTPPNNEVKPEMSEPLPLAEEVSIPDDASGLRPDGTLREKQIQGFHDQVTAGLDDDIVKTQQKFEQALESSPKAKESQLPESVVEANAQLGTDIADTQSRFESKLANLSDVIESEKKPRDLGETIAVLDENAREIEEHIRDKEEERRTVEANARIEIERGEQMKLDGRRTMEEGEGVVINAQNNQDKEIGIIEADIDKAKKAKDTLLGAKEALERLKAE